MDERLISSIQLFVLPSDQLAVPTDRGTGGPPPVVSGTIRAGGIERDVTFGVAARAHDAIDTACRTKYDRYGAKIVGSIVGVAAHDVAIRLIPAGRRDGHHRTARRNHDRLFPGHVISVAASYVTSRRPATEAGTT